MHARPYAAWAGAVLSLAAPAAALAHPGGSPQTRAQGAGAPLGSGEADPAPAGPRLLDIEPVPKSAPRPLWQPAIAPAAGLGAHLYLSDDAIEKPGFGLWLGANLYARRATIAPVLTPRVIVEINPDIRGEPTDVLIGARLGAAWMQRPFDSFWTHLTPNFIGYAHAAARVARDDRPARLRLGLGFSIPRFAPASALATLFGLPLPTAVELSFETADETRAADWLLHLSMSL